MSFITNTADISTANKSKLLELLSDPTKSTQLQVELAITVDVGEAFVKATYNLEGDGPLALTAYEVYAFFLLLHLQCIIQILQLLHVNCLVIIKGFISKCMTMLYHVQNQLMITSS